MASQRDVKNRIASVKNIQKITRAMEMVAAARLRRAEQRIAALRPYADALRRMTRQAAQAAGAEASRLPLLPEHESERQRRPAARDRRPRARRRLQLADHPRRRAHRRRATPRQGKQIAWYATGRRGVSSLTFRGHELERHLHGLRRPPAYADARSIADDLITGYVDGELDRVEIVYNAYISPLTQRVTRETLLPLRRRRSPARTTTTRSAERRSRPTARARSSTTSPTPRRSSSGWCPTTSRSRSTARWWSRPPASSARR